MCAARVVAAGTGAGRGAGASHSCQHCTGLRVLPQHTAGPHAASPPSPFLLLRAVSLQPFVLHFHGRNVLLGWR